MIPPVYLDYAATTPVDPRVAEVMAKIQKPPLHDPARECADRLRARRVRMGGKLELPQRAQLEALEAIGK